VGRNQRRVWRALVGYGRLTTRELFEHCYPHLDFQQASSELIAVRWLLVLAAVRNVARALDRFGSKVRITAAHHWQLLLLNERT
jgi:hypothetical protein